MYKTTFLSVVIPIYFLFTCPTEGRAFNIFKCSSGSKSSAKPLLTVSGLAKVAIFTTNVDAENQTLINHKCVCGALNRHFCQTRVSSSNSFSVCFHCSSILKMLFTKSVRLNLSVSKSKYFFCLSTVTKPNHRKNLSKVRTL